MSPTHAATSHVVDLDGPTHYLDFGGPAGAPLILGVHGLGGAAWNWLAVAPLLTKKYRMIALDLAGHGESPRVKRSTTVRANRALLDRFIREVVDEPVILIGNSMGGLITLLQTAAAPDLVRAAALVDPALPGPIIRSVDRQIAAQFALVAVPVIGEFVVTRHRGRQTVRQQVESTLATCTVDISRVPADVIDAGIASIESRNTADFAAADVVIAGRSLLRLLSRPTVLRRTFRTVDVPVLLLQGDHDRLVSVRVARAAARAFPEWRFEVAKDIGHVPMLEAPDWTAEQVLDWLEHDVTVTD